MTGYDCVYGLNPHYKVIRNRVIERNRFVLTLPICFTEINVKSIINVESLKTDTIKYETEIFNVITKKLELKYEKL